MTTLRDVWISQGLTSTEAAAKAKIAVPTLYALNRKETGVSWGIVVRVCKALDLTLDDFSKLERCAKAEQYRPKKGK